MASKLSPSAIHVILTQALQHGNSKFKAVYELYRNIKPTLPLDYLDSLELALVLKGELDAEDVLTIFAHRKPLGFLGCPPLLVSKIVEAFRGLQKEPAYLDVTITALSGLGTMKSSKAWTQVYTSHLPCYACSTVETVDKRSIHRDSVFGDPVGTVDFVVEIFHVSSKSFRKRLTVELHYKLEEGESCGAYSRAVAERRQSSMIHKITIRLIDEICSARGILSGIANRSSATPLLLPEFASEVFGFLDRAHFGSSLIANRTLHDRLFQLKQRLPVHHLKCAIEEEFMDRGYVQECLVIGHFQRDLSYTDVRRFKMPFTAGAENDCTLIRHHLSNSHVACHRELVYEAEAEFFPFTIKMLASLATRNFSVGYMELCAGAQRQSDYRSLDAVFGGLRMSRLSLRMAEHRFVELVKTTDFFRMATVQGMRSLNLELELNGNRYEEGTSKGNTRSKSPLWVSGIYLLRDCKYYRVDYWPDCHLRTIERKIVRICEEFERGEITDTVKHFHLKPKLFNGMNFAFSRDNLVVSGMKIEVKTRWDPINDFVWDVYRFRNAVTSDYLTACVGRNVSYLSTQQPVLHIVKGEVYPDVSFVDIA